MPVRRRVRGQRLLPPPGALRVQGGFRPHRGSASLQRQVARVELEARTHVYGQCSVGV